ncbi:MAG: lysylphosphatidylglycerol synthase transmembrane domain-containing protein [Anaerolineae bacterium]
MIYYRESRGRAQIVNFRRYWRVMLLGALVSIVALVLLVSNIDFNLLAAALKEARYIFIIPSAALIVLGLFTRALRWRVMLFYVLPLRRTFSILNVSYMVNAVVPFRAGELARAWLATRNEPPVPMFQSFSTIVVERLLDTLAVLIILALALTASPLPPELRTAAAFFAPAVLLGFLILILLSANRTRAMRWAHALANRITFLQRGHLLDWFASFLEGLRPLTTPKPLLLVLAWTAVSWAFSLASGYMLMFAFYPNPSWAAVALFTAAASFAVAVPAVPGNVGTWEASVVFSLTAMGYGVPYETALAFAVVLHALNLIVFGVMGVTGFVQEGVSLEQLSQGVQSAQQSSTAR